MFSLYSLVQQGAMYEYHSMETFCPLVFYLGKTSSFASCLLFLVWAQWESASSSRHWTWAGWYLLRCPASSSCKCPQIFCLFQFTFALISGFEIMLLPLDLNLYQFDWSGKVVLSGSSCRRPCSLYFSWSRFHQLDWSQSYRLNF